MKKYLSSLILILWFGCSTAFGEVPPEWINNPSGLYDERYLTATGIGRDRETAEADAIKALASVFGQSVDSRTEASRYMADSGEHKTSINHNVSLSTNMEFLSGAEIKQAWTSSDGKCYALAVLDKEKTAGIYYRKTEQLFRDISALLRKDENPLINCYNYKKGAELAGKQNDYITILSVLSFNTAELAKDMVFSPEEIEKELSLLMQEAPVFVSVTGNPGDRHGRLKKALSEKVQEMGCIAVYNPARFEISCEVNIEPFKLQGNPNQMVRYFMEITMKDNETGSVPDTYYIEGQTGFMTLEGAHDRVYMSLEKKIKEEYTIIK